MAEDKQHQALYRRYRPQTPSEVLGQDHVVRALTGAIRENRLHHAFLFCGPRGTGKTSTARILAKMVNCENGPTAEPCGVCTQCVAIREGQHLDVVEIDAASHGGVEDARELRERAPTAPAMGREKVYIIDEAQRLSREAFDALLKVFEEPPAGVRFVLATTEPHKMPATIVGPVPAVRLPPAHHGDARGPARGHHRRPRARTITKSAALAIARQAEGSSRDALSLLDQASVMGGETIDDAVVQSLLGAPRGEVQHELADAVAVGDARTTFEIVNRLVQDGQDIRNVTAEALAHFRNLLLVKTAPGQDDLLDIQADGYEQLRVQAEKFTPGEIARVISLLLAAQNDMRWTTSPAPVARARARPRHDPGDRPQPRRRRRPPRTPRTPGEPGRGVRHPAWCRRAARRTRRLFRSSLLRSSGPQGRRLPTHRPPSTVPEAAADVASAEGGASRRGDPEQRSREAASTGIVAPRRAPTVAVEPPVAAEAACRRRCMRRMRGRWTWRCSGGGGRR